VTAVTTLPFAPSLISIHLDMERNRVTIYSRPGCHLCEEAKRNILASACAEEFEIEEVNIDENAELYERYKYDIPVIFINGVKAFKHRVDPREFERKFRRLILRG
jgi:glutaredoxin